MKMWIKEPKGELVNMTWDYYDIKKETPKDIHTRMGEVIGGRGIRITLSAIVEKIRLYKKRNTEEAKDLVMFLEEAQDQALILLDKINDVNKFYEKNKKPHDRISEMKNRRAQE